MATMTKADALGIAQRLAADNADAHPTSTRMVATQRSKLNQPLADDQLSTDPLWVIEMTGHFVGHTAKLRQGSPKPTGTHLTVSVDPTTGEIADYSITNSPVVDVNKLGAVTNE